MRGGTVVNTLGGNETGVFKRRISSGAERVPTSVAEWRRTVVLMFDDDDCDEIIVQIF